MLCTTNVIDVNYIPLKIAFVVFCVTFYCAMNVFPLFMYSCPLAMLVTFLPDRSYTASLSPYAAALMPSAAVALRFTVTPVKYTE